MEKTVELNIPLLLPDLEDEKDHCLVRLEASLQDRKGILKAHLELDKSPADLCLHYDPDQLTLEEVQRIAQQAGARITSRFRHMTMAVEGMDCSDCALVVEHSLGRLEGVLEARVNYATGRMRVEFDSQKVDRPAIEKRVRSLGYEIPVGGLRGWTMENMELLFSLDAGILLLIGWAGSTFFGMAKWAPLLCYGLAYVFGGWDTVQHAWHALRERHFDTDILMVAAAVGAAILGDFAEGALLLFLFSLGHVLEERSLDRAREAVRALADLAPKVALVRRGDGEMEVSTGELRLGDTVIVRPGVRIPVDGIIQAGRAGVDQSPVTGESVPVDKNPGDPVFAGSVNGEGVLDVRVTRLAKDSTLARVMKMVEEAQTQKSPTQQTVEKFARIFVPSVLGLTLLVIVLPPMFGVPFRISFLRAMTLLVAASPCALALGTPAAVLTGIAQAARSGILVKGGAHLENLGRLKAIAFDKTGTITHGRPEVTDVVSFSASMDADRLLGLAAAVEKQSGHPLAQSIVRAALIKRLALPRTVEVESLTGRGVRASVGGKLVQIGSPKLMQSSGLETGAQVMEKVASLQQQGKTTMLVSLDGGVVGLIGLADTIRPESAAVMESLRRLGVSETVMLTGDNPRVAAAIARQAGLKDFRADLMPEDKVNAIRSLVNSHGLVAMVGDGVNDAPALANASVGIAMGGAGTDVALETADVALMGDDLSKIPFAVSLGRATRAIITQNLVLALGVIAALIVVALTGWASIGLAIVIHEGSTILVVLNALRLLGFRS